MDEYQDKKRSQPCRLFLESEKFCQDVLAQFLDLLHPSLLTLQPAHVDPCHFQGRIEDLLSSEELSQRDHSHHVDLVELDQQFCLCQILKVLQIEHLTHGQEGRRLFLQQVLRYLTGVDELHQAPPHVCSELDVGLALDGLLVLVFNQRLKEGRRRSQDHLVAGDLLTVKDKSKVASLHVHVDP